MSNGQSSTPNMTISYLFFLLFVLTLLALAWFFIARKNTNIQKLNQQNNILKLQYSEAKETLEEVEEKNLHLKNKVNYQSTQLLDYIMNKEKIDIQVKEMLDIIIKEEDCEQRMELIEVKLTKLYKTSTTWMGFKEKINNVYPNFFKNLCKYHPNLSKNDLKHCAFILTGLPIREICSILSVSPKTVESARYRIRKKINISPNQTTKDYLLSLLE